MPWQTQVVTQLQAGNTIINPNGMFVYNASGPGAGNLVASIANVGVTSDQFGNAVTNGGVCTYSGQAQALLANGAILLQTSTGAIAGGFAGQIFENINGQLEFISGGTAASDTQGAMILGSAGVGSGKTRLDVLTQRAAFNSSGYINQGTAPNDGNSGTTWVSGERAFMNNNWVAYMNGINSALTSMFLG